MVRVGLGMTLAGLVMAAGAGAILAETILVKAVIKVFGPLV